MNSHDGHKGTIAYKRQTSQEASVWFLGSLMTFLVEGRDSAGRFTVIEYCAGPRTEPPPHIHTCEDEFFYILEGRLDVFVDSDTFSVGPGECVFLPRNRPHAFRIDSPTARVLAVIEPAGLEGFFRALSEPADTLDSPPQKATVPEPNRAQIVELARKYGLSFLSDDEIVKQLPSLGKQQLHAQESAE